MEKKRVIKHFGSVRKTAEAFGLTTQAVYAWPAKVRKHIALEAEKLSEGRLKYKDKEYAE